MCYLFIYFTISAAPLPGDEGVGGGGERDKAPLTENDISKIGSKFIYILVLETLHFFSLYVFDIYFYSIKKAVQRTFFQIKIKQKYRLFSLSLQILNQLNYEFFLI